jgi:hypothetical protein
VIGKILIAASLLATAATYSQTALQPWAEEQDLFVQTKQKTELVDQNTCVNRGAVLNALAEVRKEITFGDQYSWAVSQALSYRMKEEGRDFCDSPKKGSSTSLVY